MNDLTINGKSTELWINGRQVLADRVVGGTWTKIGTWALPSGAVIPSPQINGTIATTGLTLPAITLGGTVTLNGRVFDAGAGSAQINSTGAGGGLTLQVTNTGDTGTRFKGSHLSTSPAVGDVLLRIYGEGLDADTPQNLTSYMYLDFKIADATAGSEDGLLAFNGIAAGADNAAMTLTGAGVLSVDLGGSGTPAQVDLFDDYDDAMVLRQGIQQNNRELLADMGVLERKDTGSGYMLKIQPMVRLLAGGIYQTRQMVEDTKEELHGRLTQLENKLMLLEAK